MAELLFKKGLHASLAAAAKKAGTLYVTTDEKCLYLDVSDTERIRLQGSVLYYSTLEEFYKNEQPPYSTDVIYFIEKDSEGNQFNALMRWNAATSEWIQLNATASSVDNAIKELQRQITANAGTLTTHGTALEGIMTRLATVEGYVGAPAHKGEGGENVAASGLHAAVATNAADIDAIEEAIGDDNTADSLKGRIKAIETDIGTDSTEGSVKGRIKAVEGRLDAMDDVDEDHAKRIKALEDAPAKATQADFQALYDQVNTGDNSIVKQIESNDADILALQTNSATKTALKEVSDALSEHVAKAATDEELGDVRDDLQGKIDAINAELGDPSVEGKPAADGTVWHAIEANVAEIAAINEALGNGDGTNSITSRLTAVEGQASDNKGAIEGLTTKVGIPETPAYDEGVSNLYGQVAKNKADIADHEGRIDDLETAVGDANSGLVKKAEDNRLAIAENVKNIAANLKSIQDLTKALEDHSTEAAETYATKEAVEDIEADLNSKILAANAMRYIGTAASKADLGKGIDVSVGDTYVASTELYNDDNSLFAHAGDLIIAKGTEVDGVISAESLTWDVVDTGYVRAHENKLVLEQADGSTLVHLKNYADQDVSSFAIKSTSANVAVAAKDSTVEISLQWAEF